VSIICRPVRLKNEFKTSDPDGNIVEVTALSIGTKQHLKDDPLVLRRSRYFFIFLGVSLFKQNTLL
jgi:hypothetical protein